MAVLMHMQTALASALTADPTDLPGCINWTSISAAVRESLEVSLGLQEPQLVQLLQVCQDLLNEVVQYISAT